MARPTLLVAPGAVSRAGRRGGGRPPVRDQRLRRWCGWPWKRRRRPWCASMPTPGRGWHRLAASSVLTDRRLTQHALGEVYSRTGRASPHPRREL